MRDASNRPWIERHRTVMPLEVIDFLRVKQGGVYLDATFGEGGHSELLLERGAGRVIGFDRDEAALKRYGELGALAGDPRLTLCHSRFSRVSAVLEHLGIRSALDGAVADLGISTKQILDPERGFTFRRDAEIDMRMDRSEEENLIDKLASCDERELMGALREFADVRGAPRIARELKQRAKRGDIRVAGDIASLAGGSTGTKHPATQLFMALRVWLNEEMVEARQGLPAIFNELKPEGRLVVLSFHSAEDRAVKQTFQLLAGKCICGESFCLCPRVKKAELITPKPVEPTREECRKNPRARSAKLRCVEKNPPLP